MNVATAMVLVFGLFVIGMSANTVSKNFAQAECTQVTE